MKSFFNSRNNIVLEFTEQTILKIIDKFKEEASEDDIRFYLDKFERYKNKLNIKDPFQYKTFIELEQTVDKVERETNERNAIVRNKKPVSNEKSDVDQEDVVVDNDDVTIYKGDSQDKCVIYGAGYSFCISRQSGGNMFSNYRLGKESTFYFIYFKKKPKTANDHIMVLDHTKNGYEWTFNDNNTRPVNGGWNEIVEKYPELTPYKDLLINKKLDEEEKQFVYTLKEFSNNPSLKKFDKFSYKQKIQALKTVVDLPDNIFKTLDSFLINEFISIGPNLTDYQASSLNPTQVKRYQKQRAISLPQMDETNYLIKFNILDSSPEILDFISQSRNWSLDYYFNINKDSGNSVIEEFGKAHERVVNNFGKVVRKENSSNVNLSNYNFYILPDLSDLDIRGSFNCSNNNLKSLKGAPKSVRGSFDCSNNNITSLEGAPKWSVGGGFDCYNNRLTSLKGSPKSVGGSFKCNYNNLTSLEGSPENIEGDFQYNLSNTLNSLKGISPFIKGRVSLDNYFSHEEIIAAIENSRREWQNYSESFKYFFYKRSIS
jgi:hypothetical protein